MSQIRSGRSKQWAYALAVSVVCAASSAHAAGKMGLLPLEHEGADDPGYGELQAAIRQNVGGYSSAPVVDVPAPRGCNTSDPHCAARAGNSAHVDVVIFGSVERFTDGYALRLRTVDVKTLDQHEVKRLVQGG